MRPPAVAGRFYPADPAALEREIRVLLSGARVASHPARAAVAPHAGYRYSGATAAAVFAAVEVPRLVVVLGPNHTGVCRAASGVSLWEAGALRTPLGDVPVDAEFAAALLAASPLVAVDREAHRAEHAIEVQLPFLQIRRNDVAVVPLVMAGDAWETAGGVGEALARLVRAHADPVLLLASTDLTHYEPAATAERKDREALAAVRELDGAELLARCRRERISMCGRAPTATVLAAARALGASGAVIVDYRHSGWSTGDDAAVVGYGGAVIA